MVTFEFTNTYSADSIADAEARLMNDIVGEFGMINNAPDYDIEEADGVYRVRGTVKIPDAEFLSTFDDAEDRIEEYLHPATYNRNITIKSHTVSVRCDIDFEVSHPDPSKSEIKNQGMVVAKEAFETDAIEPEDPVQYANRMWRMRFTATIGSENSIVQVPVRKSAQSYTPIVEWDSFNPQ